MDNENKYNNQMENQNSDFKKELEMKNKEEEIRIKPFIIKVFYSFLIILVLWTSILFSFSENIWFMERFFAMISYFLFFFTVLVGILRKLGPKYSWTIKYHKPTAIWAVMFLIFHVISVIFDNFKWGYQLNLLTYFGLDYSSKWLWPTSIGAIAMWIFFIIISTSIGNNIRNIGFKTWKKIHYLTYIGFILMSIHALNIGTDFLHETYSIYLFWFAIFMNLIIFILFIKRINYSKNKI